MNVCDIDKDDRRINLGEDYIYNIPKTLRFLATINYDHTTEVLSPRLIDRAWIVLLDYSYDDNILYDEDSNVEENDEIVTFEDIEKYFLDNFKNNGIPASIIESLDEICREFNKNNICVSPRIRKIINMYLKTGVNIFESSKNTSREYAALDYAVAQKLLPKINGQGEKYEEFLKNLMNLFKDKNMTKCVVILKRIIENDS
jgi:MoxR-like ATPase